MNRGTKTGFALLALVLVAAVLLTIWQVARTQAVTLQLVNQSAPMVESSLRVINGMSTAAAQARGWMLLEDEKFKTGWAAAYSDWIDPSVTNLKSLSEKSGSTSLQEQVRLVEAKLPSLQLEQSLGALFDRLEVEDPGAGQVAPGAVHLVVGEVADVHRAFGRDVHLRQRVVASFQFAQVRGGPAPVADAAHVVPHTGSALSR